MQSVRSADDQLRECRAYAAREGWAVVAEERDEMVRAGDMAGRRGYQRLVELARARQFDVLVCEELSRFSRNLFEAFGELGPLTGCGVQLATLREGLLDLTDAPGLIQASVGFTMAQVEVKKIGERSKRGLRGRVLAKFSGGGVAPYGYRRRAVLGEERPDGTRASEGVRFEPHPDEAPVVRRIFSEYAAGLAKHAIAVGLNRDGVPTRQAGKPRGVGPDGSPHVVQGKWTAAVIGAVLGNPIHIGRLIWGKKSRRGEKVRGGRKRQIRTDATERLVVDDFCEPIVDRAVWDVVQTRLLRDLETFRARTIPNANQARGYLLSGLLKCATCGAAFTIGARRGGAPAYRCPTHASGGACSNKTVVSQVGLEERVRFVVEVVAKDPRKLAELVADHNARVDETNASVLAAISRLQDRLRERQAARGRLVEAITLGGDIASLVDALRLAEDDCRRLDAQIGEARARVQPRLHPRLDIADYEVGDAPLLSEESAAAPADRQRIQTRNKLLLQRLLDSVLAFDDGSVYVQFATDGVFSAAQEARIDPGVPSVRAALAGRRQAMHQARLRAELNLSDYEPRPGEDVPLPEVTVEADGVTVSMRAVGPTDQSLWRHAEDDRASLFADLQGPPEGEETRVSSGPHQVILASPAGVEPALAT